jgi:hypothetical protein
MEVTQQSETTSGPSDLAIQEYNNNSHSTTGIDDAKELHVSENESATTVGLKMRCGSC